MSRPRVIDRAAVRRYAAAGMSRRAIARQLGLASSTVLGILRSYPKQSRAHRCRRPARPRLTLREMKDRVLAARLGWPGLWSREAVCLLAFDQHPVPWMTADEVAIGAEGLRDLLDLAGRGGVETIERLLAGLVTQGYVVRIGGARTRAKYLLSERAREELRRRAMRRQIPAVEIPVVRSYAYDQ